MIYIAAIAVVLSGLVASAANTNKLRSDKIASTRDFSQLQREVETLRGKAFRHPVPVFKISTRKLRAISDRELDKDFPGAKLHGYEQLLAWLDVVPPETNLKAVYGDFLVDQVAGLYDADTKEMCLPGLSGGTNNPAKKAEKKLEAVNLQFENIVLAHEFTHALEDQYWPLDVPADHDFKRSTDHATAHSFLAEGSATRQMIEVLPAQLGSDSPELYFLLWNAMHSGAGEWALNHELSAAWKTPDALSEGVPDTLARTEAMPYSFGYSFCTRIMRDWGLDGLDYIYNHPPVSSTQVMHPAKCWEWRDVPVQINLPETLPGEWKQVSLDCVGEAGIAVLLGCQFDHLNRGLYWARGWDGDHVALYAGPGKRHLLLWASSWDSAEAAERFVGAWLKERQLVHKAAVTRNTGTRIEWNSPEGCTGVMLREGKRVILLETDSRNALQNADGLASAVTFIEPREDTARAAANSPWRRFNPLWSWQRDGDYTVTRSLGGLLSRHDRNGVGAADTFLFGVVAETRRTPSFHKWKLGAGFLARHESEARRGFTETTLLPWGVLASHCSAPLPQAPEILLERTSVLWGLGACETSHGTNHSLSVLPFGLLLHRSTDAGESALYVLGTGASRTEATRDGTATTRFRLLGIPLWTTPTRSGVSSERPNWASRNQRIAGGRRLEALQ